MCTTDLSRKICVFTCRQVDIDSHM